jgi:hypothetical protein
MHFFAPHRFAAWALGGVLGEVPRLVNFEDSRVWGSVGANSARTYYQRLSHQAVQLFAYRLPQVYCLLRPKEQSVVSGFRFRD